MTNALPTISKMALLEAVLLSVDLAAHYLDPSGFSVFVSRESALVWHVESTHPVEGEQELIIAPDDDGEVNEVFATLRHELGLLFQTNYSEEYVNPNEAIWLPA